MLPRLGGRPVGYLTGPGFLFVRNFFPWVAANEAPEFIKNPKPRAWLVVLTARPWVSPSRRGCLPCPPGGYPTDPRSAEPEGRRRCRGRERQHPPWHNGGKAQMHRALPEPRPALLWDPRGQGCAAGRTGLGGSSCGKSGLSTMHINALRALIAVGPIWRSH